MLVSGIPLNFIETPICSENTGLFSLKIDVILQNCQATKIRLRKMKSGTRYLRKCMKGERNIGLVILDEKI